MPKTTYRQSTLSELIDSDSDDAQFALPSPNSASENTMPPTKTRGRPKAGPTKVTKSKAPARRTSGRLIGKQGAPAPSKLRRKALAEITNEQFESEAEDVQQFDQGEDSVMLDELEGPVIPTKEKKAQAASRKGSAPRGKPTKGSTSHAVEDVIFDSQRVDASKAKKAPAKRIATAEPALEKVIPETQAPDAMEVDEDTYGDGELEPVQPKPTRKFISARQRQASIPRRRAGSASDTERSDPALRRKLGDLTKKYDLLNVKHEDMREIGLKEAERNFERYKKQSEEKIAASEKLFTSLKADEASRLSLTKESRGLKKKIELQSTEISALHAQITKLTTSLSEANAQNKILSAKLASNRSVASSVESANAKIPSTLAKGNGGIRLMGTAETAQEVQEAKLKEHLYSDLTGLLIMGVKRDADDDIFDCIQTGRNGTLHFKLSVTSEKSAESYEEAQCSYVPKLDPSRDRDLMELLPDYLVDEISFPRQQAPKFYARVVKALMEQI